MMEEMAKPISMPVQREKNEYERVKDNTIREPHLAMKEFGMFAKIFFYLITYNQS